MRDFLDQLPEIINKLFDAFDLLVVRLALLVLIVLGALSLIKAHSDAPHPDTAKQHVAP